MHLSKAQDYMDSMLWEQEAASSSLATPTTRKAARKRLRTFPGGFLLGSLSERQPPAPLVE